MKAAAIIILGVITSVILYTAAYRVYETDQVIITRFGNPIGEVITEPGLHFKVPFLDKINRFDKRWLEWDGDADEMPTKEKTYILVDTFARWRIVDALKFFQSVRDERNAQSRLDDIIDAEVRNVIAAHDLIEVVRTSNRDFVEPEVADETDAEQRKTQQDEDLRIEVGRDVLRQQVIEKSQRAMPEFGIELVDVQFQRVNYTESVEKKVFERMISERKRIAERYRSEGEGEAARIRGEKDRDLKEIESTAYKQVQEIKGAADAEATAIYAAAHNLDPQFYRLTKSLESYKETLDAESLLMLSTESDYFRTLVDAAAK